MKWALGAVARPAERAQHQTRNEELSEDHREFW